MLPVVATWLLTYALTGALIWLLVWVPRVLPQITDAVSRLRRGDRVRRPTARTRL